MSVHAVIFCSELMRCFDLPDAPPDILVPLPSMIAFNPPTLCLSAHQSDEPYMPVARFETARCERIGWIEARCPECRKMPYMKYVEVAK